MLAVCGKDDPLIFVWPVRADRMQTKLIMNGIVKNQRQKIERDDAAQRARQRVTESLQIAVPGDRLGKVEQCFVDVRTRNSHIHDGISPTGAGCRN